MILVVKIITWPNNIFLNFPFLRFLGAVYAFLLFFFYQMWLLLLFDEAVILLFAISWKILHVPVISKQEKYIWRILAWKCPVSLFLVQRYDLQDFKKKKKYINKIDKQLADKDYLIGELSIADFAWWPWVRCVDVGYKGKNKNTNNEFFFFFFFFFSFRSSSHEKKVFFF